MTTRGTADTTADNNRGQETAETADTADTAEQSESEDTATESEDLTGEDKIMAPKKSRSRGSISGSTVSERVMRTRSQTRGREAEEIDVEAEMENIVATTNPPNAQS